MRPPLDEQELRAMLVEADVAVDDAILPSLLVGVQPMRAKLRAASVAQRRILLRLALFDAGAIPPAQPARPQPAPARSTEPEPPPPRPTFRNLAARLGTLWIATVMGMFALMAMGSWFAFAFAVIASLLLCVAVTGRGLGGWERPPATAPSHWSIARSRGGLLVVVGLLWFLGVPGILLVMVRSVIDPRFYAEGDFVTRAMQVLGVLVIVIVASHFLRQKRRP
jgi:hypothetical protein